MADEPGDVRPGILRKRPRLAGLDVHERQGAGVSTAALEHVQIFARFIQQERCGGHHVGRRDAGEQCPTVGAGSLVHLAAAGRRHFHTEVDLHVVVGDVAEKPVVVLFDERHLAGGDVDAVDVV